MKLLRKLLDNLGDRWNKQPKEIPFLDLELGAGLHSRVTVDEGVLHFHTAPYRPDLPEKQSIALKGLDTDELLLLVQSMGYNAVAAAEGTDAGCRPLALIEQRDMSIPVSFPAFSSGVWRRLYPLYRALRQADMDTDAALRQLNRTMSSGNWLDYWASFFAIQRNPRESDNQFVRRFTTWLFNPKTNNIALQELLSYRLQDTNIEVRDRAPAEFELLVGTKYLDDASDLHEILMEAKGAGIRYFLNYLTPTLAEDYRAYASDLHGRPFSELDVLSSILKTVLSETYPTPQEELSVLVGFVEQHTLPSDGFKTAFRLGVSRLGQGKLGNEYTAFQDVMTVTLRAAGEIIFEESY
ncbi:hypothetical protein [Paenibacillus durus]|uniref:Uncharacterized protein n=1 Tax=Paenibacillus durus ATCC 35681 TaxID=1333534 RepID=A0A0F7FBM6_PAEDU|nr:hypothetical protein [Paenibacillus durus]AKG36079.1 hypothetical protein VK70_17200 [Paenibacillus durus ATCC 35681]